MVLFFFPPVLLRRAKWPFFRHFRGAQQNWREETSRFFRNFHQPTLTPPSQGSAVRVFGFDIRSTPQSNNVDFTIHDKFRIQTCMNDRILCTHRTVVNMGYWGKRSLENHTADYPASN